MRAPSSSVPTMPPRLPLARNCHWSLRQPGCRGLDGGEVVVVDEVGAVAAAALLEVLGRAGQHALAAVAEDAGPRREQERDVEDPGAVLVGIFERDPLVEVLGSDVPLLLGGHPQTIGRYLDRCDHPGRRSGPPRGRSPGRAGQGPGAHRADRARPLPAGRLEHGGRPARSSASRRPPRRCRPACGRPPPRRPFVARGSGTGLAGGAVPLDGAGGDRHHEDEPGAVGRPRRPQCVGRARRAQPRPDPAAGRRTALHFAPDPSSQQACSVGGNVATNSGGPHCLAYGVTSAHVLAVEVVLPDGDGRRARRARPRARRARPAGRVRRRRGHARHRHPHRRAPHAGPAGGAHAAARLRPRGRRRGHRVSAIIAAGLVPAALEMMDAAHHAGRRGLRPRRLPDRRRGHPASSRSTGCPARSRPAVERVTEIGRAHGARTVRVAADEAERALIWKGRKTRLRRHRPDQAELLPARHRRAPGAAWSRCCARSTRSPRATS